MLAFVLTPICYRKRLSVDRNDYLVLTAIVDVTADTILLYFNNSNLAETALETVCRFDKNRSKK